MLGSLIYYLDLGSGFQVRGRVGDSVLFWHIQHYIQVWKPNKEKDKNYFINLDNKKLSLTFEKEDLHIQLKI